MSSSRSTTPTPAAAATTTTATTTTTELQTMRSSSAKLGPMRLATLIVCSVCLAACLLPARQVEAGRLQDFIHNLVGGGSSSSSSSSSGSGAGNSNKEASGSSSSSSSSSGDSSDSDAAASSDSNEQPMAPMMSAMSPFMRYPSFYDSFGPAGFGAFPGMSFSNPMGAMSAMSPMAALSSGSPLSSAFSPTAFGSFGHSSSNPMSAFGGPTAGMSASTLSNVYASSPSLMAGYTPYYGRKR